MNTSTNAVIFPEPPPGIVYLKTPDEALGRQLVAYQHPLRLAWEKLGLSGVLVIRGIPTVYLREDKVALPPEEVNRLQKLFWNQGVATLLVLVDPNKTRVFSSMVPPEQTPAAAKSRPPLNGFVAELNIAGQALRAHREATRNEAAEAYRKFCRQVASGHFYRLYGGANAKEQNFNPRGMVDAHLLNQLSFVRDKLTRGKNKRNNLAVETAHAFLGRLLFTCYLVDRGIVRLDDEKYFPKKQWNSIRQILEGNDDEVLKRLYNRLFPQLKRDFNGSMFDDEKQDAERAAIRPEHLQAIRLFFGLHDVATGQQNLSLWHYDFSIIPVETISAIYETFLAGEDEKKKREEGAFYTPRFLAELTIDIALENEKRLSGLRFLDPSCGSGIFLVLLFNRLAAEWVAKYPKKAFATTAAAFAAKDQALREALASLRGVDKDLTACRIACFSLYLAFLDQFEPNDIRVYIQRSERKLPNLLWQTDGRGKKPDIPVIWEGYFSPLSQTWEKDAFTRFNYIIGNPPWVRRGEKQLANDFMKRTPGLLAPDGKATLLLPSKVFFNKTDAFQLEWLKSVTLEKVLLLSDYRFILFTNAICPCMITRFNAQPPNLETHYIEYLTPKVSRVDLRQGAIPVTSNDRKSIRLRYLLARCQKKEATFVWKGRSWGTPRDEKFYDHLFALPQLGSVAGTPAQVRKGEKRWAKGQGFKPLYIGAKPDGIPKPIKARDPDAWSLDDAYADVDFVKDMAFFPEKLCDTLGDFLSQKGRSGERSKTHLRRKSDVLLSASPLVLINQGFTYATFYESKNPVRFQDSLQSIVGPPADTDYLIFLAACLRSRFARYFAFHVSANMGMERGKAHLDEVLKLPFGLHGVDDFAAQPSEKARAEKIVREVAAKFKKLHSEISKSARDLIKRSDELPGLADSSRKVSSDERKEWAQKWREKTSSIQAEIEPLICEYYGFIDQERILIEDTCEIFKPSATPGRVDTPIPTLELLSAKGLKDYAETLAQTLKSWSINESLTIRPVAGVDESLALGILKIERINTPSPFNTAPLAKELAEAVKRIEEAASTTNGTLAYLQDETWWVDGPVIHIAKPALRGRWTRTAALNDAAEIYASIQQSRRQTP
jgi:hypothetical protein